jgi:hypothetical protein
MLSALLRKTLPLLLICGIAFSLGCGTRTIYVKKTDPVRLREKLYGVKVWVFDKNGNAVAGVLDLDEGLYVLSDGKP